MTLPDNIHQLTNQHLTRRHGRKPVRVVSLLDQLAAAVAPSKGGGPSASGAAQLPIDTKALDKAMSIENEARDIQNEMLGVTGGTLKGIIRSWYPQMVLPAWAEYLELITDKWVLEITQIVAPPPMYRPSAPCPHCGQRFTGDDRQPALAVTYTDETGKVLHPSAWRMVCAGCGTDWTGNQLGAIAHAIANQTKGKAS